MNIDLAKHYKGESKIFAGRERGARLRSDLNLNKIDRSEDFDPTIVTIPKEVLDFSISFFLGMFGPSVKYFGSEKAFFARYNFMCDDRFFNSAIEDGIKRALLEKVEITLPIIIEEVSITTTQDEGLDSSTLYIIAKATVSHEIGSSGNHRLEILSSSGLGGIKSEGDLEDIMCVIKNQIIDLQDHLRHFGIDEEATFAEADHNAVYINPLYQIGDPVAVYTRKV